MLRRDALFCAAAIWAVLFTLLPHSDAQTRTAIYSISSEGGEAKKLAQAAGYNWHGSPAWTRDGQRLAFDAYPGDVGTQNAHVFLVDADGTNLKDLGYGSAPDWTPDAKQLAYHMRAGNAAGARPGVWVMNADGTGREWLADGSRPRWSPDGTKLLFVVPADGGQNLAVLDTLDSSQTNLLERGYRYVWGGAWSPDGKQVAVSYQSDSQELAIVSAEGAKKGLRVRWTAEFGMRPHWSADGKRLVAPIRGGDGSTHLHVIDVTGDGPSTPIDGGGGSNVNSDPAFSPDGKSIAFNSDR